MPLSHWELYPAAAPELAVRYLTLRSRLSVRAVESGRPDGATVLLLPGLASSIYEYRHTFPALARAGFRVIAVDLKGHGLSDKPGVAREYTLDAMRQHVVEILDVLKVDRAHLVGHSLGGAIATEVALCEPGRVGRLALIAPVGYGRLRLASVARWLSPSAVEPLLQRFVSRTLVRLVVRHFLWGRNGGPSERDVDEYWAMARQDGFLTAMRLLVHNVEWSPCEDGRLVRLGVPLLVIFGSADRVIPPRALDCYVRDVPGARTVLIDGAGHLANEERPDQVNQALLEFLNA
jgi:pimeloyl-ACP methyl ester carboxylesterase